MNFTEAELEEMAVLAIYNYINNTKLKKEDIKTLYRPAMELLKARTNSIIEAGINGAKSIKKGEKSITYADGETKIFFLDADIRALLPKPFIKLF